MAMIFGLLAMLAGLAAFVPAVLFLIQLYKAKGPGHAVGGFCCGFYLLYWGWQNAEQLDASNPPPLMGMKYAQLIRVLLGLAVVSFVLQILGNVFARM